MNAYTQYPHANTYADLGGVFVTKSDSHPGRRICLCERQDTGNSGGEGSDTFDRGKGAFPAWTGRRSFLLRNDTWSLPSSLIVYCPRRMWPGFGPTPECRVTGQ